MNTCSISYQDWTILALCLEGGWAIKCVPPARYILSTISTVEKNSPSSKQINSCRLTEKPSEKVLNSQPSSYYNWQGYLTLESALAAAKEQIDKTNSLYILGITLVELCCCGRIDFSECQGLLISLGFVTP